MLADTKLKSFIESVAAKTPTPGGGSVAAASCAMGAALAVMVARYTEGAAETAEKLEPLKDEFVRLIDADAAAYDRVDAALGLPKEKPEEKARRKEALQSALREAADTPLQGMRLAVRTLQAVLALAAASNKNLVSDLGSAALMLEAGLLGCSLNVKANARLFADKAAAAGLEKQAADLIGEGNRARTEILGQVERTFAK